MSALPDVLRYPLLIVTFLGLLASTAATDFDRCLLRITPTGTDDEPGPEPAGQALASGSVRVRYQGAKRFLQITTLTWQDGRWTAGAGTTGPTSVPLDHQVFVILHDASRLSQDKQYRGVVADRTDDQLQTITFNIAKGQAQAGDARLLKLHSTVDVPDDQPVAIWGYAAYDNAALPSADEPIRQQAEKAVYAVIVTVQMLDQPANVPHAAEASILPTSARPDGPAQSAATSGRMGSMPKSWLDGIW